MADVEDESYLDYETFLDPTFSPTAFANTLVLATNNANDTPLDLTTPLSRVVFDVQEVDTRLDKLTNVSALPILNYTKDNVDAGERMLHELEGQIAALTGSYERLETEIIHRHEAAEETRLAAQRLWETVKLGRSVGRCLTLGRQLETQMADLKGTGVGAARKEDHRAMVRGANTILSVRQIFDASGPGEEAEGLLSLNVIRSLRESVIDASERNIITRAEQTIGQFSMSTLTASNADPAPTPTFAQLEDTRSRATSALLALYLLSPVSKHASMSDVFEPSYLIPALQEYLRRAITSSLAGLTTALSTLPKLDRTLLEVSARCQNIVALEVLLSSIKPPPHPLLALGEPGSSASAVKPLQESPATLLIPLLNSLDTSSLPSYFWRSMASQLSSRVQKILKDGGVSARTLRSNKDRVREAIRSCVNKGSQLPTGTAAGRTGMGKDGNSSGTITVGNWEREAAVMVGAVVNVLGR